MDNTSPHHTTTTTTTTTTATTTATTGALTAVPAAGAVSPVADPQATIDELDRVLAAVDAVRAEADKSKRFGFDDPWSVFIRKMRLLTPQAYGGRIQRWLEAFYGWTHIPASADRGDIRTSDGEYWEVKVTIITPSNPSANFVQLRPHQDISGYELFVVDADYAVTRFRLNKEAMAREIAALGGSAHGTQAAVIGNANREYAIRFPWEATSALVTRWKGAYEVPSGISATSVLPVRKKQRRARRT